MVTPKAFWACLVATASFTSALPLSQPSYSYNQTSASGCQQLERVFPNLTSFPQSSEYQARIIENWSETCIERSTCVFEPTNVNDVARAVQILVRSGTKFALRGGGHMPNPGASSITDGVLISMNRLTQMTLVNRNTVAQVGSGLRWSTVYDWISPFGLGVVGGRYAPVGVPGLLLGGGISYFGSTYGWAANMVVNMQVVLADGSIVNANSTANSDLFWALKGGSSNFGIVTRFDIKAFPLTSIYGGTTVYEPRYINQYLEATAYYSLQSGGSSDYATSANPSMTYAPATGELQVYMLMSRVGNDSNPRAFANYSRIPSLSDNRSVRFRLNQFTNETAGAAFSDRSERQYFRSTGLVAGPESVYLTNRTFFSTIESMPALRNVSGLMLSPTHQTITAEMLRQARRAGGDVMDLDPNDGNHIAFLVNSAWQNAADDALVVEFNRRCMRNIEREAKARGLYYDFRYLNDEPEESRPFDSYGTRQSSLRRMRRIARTYDPKGVFQTLLPGGFKVFY